MSICVCAKCKKPWKASGSPARCQDCGQVSFAIAEPKPVTDETTLTGKPLADETRGKMSAPSKKLWQDPEYRARQIATHTGRHPSLETRAKISAALTRRWHNRKRGIIL